MTINAAISATHSSIGPIAADDHGLVTSGISRRCGAVGSTRYVRYL